MVKKQALLVVVAMMSLFVSSAFGLGLGDIKVNSNLNEPLDAEIDLIQLQGLTAGEILPTLASNDDFNRAGVERSFFLSNINFRVRESDSGDVLITLQTKQPVREPFLNFLVEVNWPGGRLLKEYTILLDPPVFDTGLAVDALVVDSTSTPSTELVTTTVIDEVPVVETTSVAVAVEPREDNLPAGQYRVQRNDTLWEIALKVPDRSGYSPQQVMLAIQDLNPQAFLKSNINRVKAGSVLTFPTAAQIETRTFQEAIDEVQAQNRGAAPNLRAPVEGGSEVQLSATDSTSSALPADGGERNPDGYLELTSESSSGVSATGDSDASLDELRTQLAIAEELSDQFERERDDLQSRVSELQDQVEIMERLLELQNSDLAQVQDALAEQQQSTDSAPAVDTQPADTATATTPAQTTTQDSTATTQTQTQTTTQRPSGAVPAPAPKQDFMWYVNEYVGGASDWVMKSTTNMAIAGGALFLLILIPVYLRSRNKGSNKTLGEMIDNEEEEFETESFSTDLDEDLLADVEDDFEEEVSTESQPEQLDAVMEAEMYMAYQKYDQAEEKLKEAFSQHPDRADVGLKLLEVYAETGNANEFNDLESRLSLDSDQQSLAGELRAKLPSTAMVDESLDDDLMAGDLDLGMDAPTSAAEPAVSDDFDLDLDLGDEPVEEPSLDAGSDDLDLGSDLDFGTEAEAEPAAEEPDLDFSLDLGDLDSSVTEEEPLESDLDFGMEEPAAEVPDLDLGIEEAPVAESTESDLDFSLDMGEDEPVAESDDLSLDLDMGGLDDVATEPELEESPSLDMGDADLDLGGDDLSLDLDSSVDSLEVPSLEEESSDSLDLEMPSLDETPELETADDGLSVDLGGDDLSADLGMDLTEEAPALEEPSVDMGLDMEPAAESTTEIDLGGDPDPLQQLADSLDSDADLEDDEFDFLSGNDEASTKLDLARAYIEMDDKEGARDILEEVAQEGSDDQKAQAQELIGQL